MSPPKLRVIHDRVDFTSDELFFDPCDRDGFAERKPSSGGIRVVFVSHFLLDTLQLRVGVSDGHHERVKRIDSCTLSLLLRPCPESDELLHGAQF